MATLTNKTSKTPAPRPTPRPGSGNYNNGAKTSNQSWQVANQRLGTNFGPQDSSAILKAGVGAAASRLGGLAQMPMQTSGSGGGSRSGRGGGGGGGAAGMDQSMFDAMLSVIGQNPGTYNPVLMQNPELQNIGAFDLSMFDGLRQRLQQALIDDRQVINQGFDQTDQALRSNFQNAYAGMQAAPTQLRQIGGNLVGGNVQGAEDAQMAATGEANAFNNLLGILRGNADMGQQSRLNQVALGRNDALTNLQQQSTGMGAQIDMRQGQAQQDWQRRDEERRYQNQQLLNQIAMQNNQLQNQAAQSNWQAQNQSRSNMIQPLLDLIAQTQGRNLNTGGIQQLLSQFGV